MQEGRRKSRIVIGKLAEDEGDSDVQLNIMDTNERK
jgi:hypothetical protein